MTDLETLGKTLRDRRKPLRIPRAELARRIEVSPTYVWLIENARPRPSGEPSRPSEDVLERWTAALGMDSADTRHILDLAGYFEARPSYSATPMSPPLPMRSPAPDPAASAPPARSMPLDRESAGSAQFFQEPMEALRSWSGAESVQEDTVEEPLTERLHQVMRVAGSQGRGEEATTLLESFLRWLETHLERRA